MDEAVGIGKSRGIGQHRRTILRYLHNGGKGICTKVGKGGEVGGVRMGLSSLRFGGVLRVENF